MLPHGSAPIDDGGAELFTESGQPKMYAKSTPSAPLPRLQDGTPVDTSPSNSASLLVSKEKRSASLNIVAASNDERHSTQYANWGEDEFSYALQGNSREGRFACYVPADPPQHLVTDVAAPLSAVYESVDEIDVEQLSGSGGGEAGHHGDTLSALYSPVQDNLLHKQASGSFDQRASSLGNSSTLDLRPPTGGLFGRDGLVQSGSLSHTSSPSQQLPTPPAFAFSPSMLGPADQSTDSAALPGDPRHAPGIGPQASRISSMLTKALAHEEERAAAPPAANDALAVSAAANVASSASTDYTSTPMDSLMSASGPWWFQGPKSLQRPSSPPFASDQPLRASSTTIDASSEFSPGPTACLVPQSSSPTPNNIRLDAASAPNSAADDPPALVHSLMSSNPAPNAPLNSVVSASGASAGMSAAVGDSTDAASALLGKMSETCGDSSILFHQHYHVEFGENASVPGEASPHSTITATQYSASAHTFTGVILPEDSTSVGLVASAAAQASRDAAPRPAPMPSPPLPPPPPPRSPPPAGAQPVFSGPAPSDGSSSPDFASATSRTASGTASIVSALSQLNAPAAAQHPLQDAGSALDTLGGEDDAVQDVIGAAEIIVVDQMSSPDFQGTAGTSVLSLPETGAQLPGYDDGDLERGEVSVEGLSVTTPSGVITSVGGGALSEDLRGSADAQWRRDSDSDPAQLASNGWAGAASAIDALDVCGPQSGVAPNVSSAWMGAAAAAAVARMEDRASAPDVRSPEGSVAEATIDALAGACSVQASSLQGARAHVSPGTTISSGFSAGAAQGGSLGAPSESTSAVTVTAAVPMPHGPNSRDQLQTSNDGEGHSRGVLGGRESSASEAAPPAQRTFRGQFLATSSSADNGVYSADQSTSIEMHTPVAASPAGPVARVAPRSFPIVASGSNTDFSGFQAQSNSIFEPESDAERAELMEAVMAAGPESPYMEPPYIASPSASGYQQSDESRFTDSRLSWQESQSLAMGGSPLDGATTEEDSRNLPEGPHVEQQPRSNRRLLPDGRRSTRPFGSPIVGHGGLRLGTGTVAGGVHGVRGCAFAGSRGLPPRSPSNLADAAAAEVNLNEGLEHQSSAGTPIAFAGMPAERPSGHLGGQAQHSGIGSQTPRVVGGGREWPAETPRQTHVVSVAAEYRPGLTPETVGTPAEWSPALPYAALTRPHSLGTDKADSRTIDLLPPQSPHTSNYQSAYSGSIAPGSTGRFLGKSVEECRECVHSILAAAAEECDAIVIAAPLSLKRTTSIVRRMMPCVRGIAPPLPPFLDPHLQHLQTAASTRVQPRSIALHMRALDLLYLECTGLGSPGPVGPHWERIGFQGSDPSTDFRAGGSLALAHLLALFVHDETRARAIWQLSQNEPEFPMALLGINITKWGLDLAADGALNAAALRRSSLVDTVEKWYIGTFYYFTRQWQTKPVAVSDIGFRMMQIERHAKSKVAAMIELARKRRKSKL